MAITFGTTYKSGLIEANPSATFAITVPAGAQMYVGVQSNFPWGAAKAVSGITANGIALTKLEDLTHPTDHVRRFELWHLKAPDTGSQNLVVTLTGPTDVDHRVGVIVRFPIGADPTAPVRDSAIVDDMGIDYVGPSVTSAVGDTVVDFGYARTDVADFVADAGQTDPQTTGTASNVIFSSVKAGASPTVTTGWEDQSSGSPGYDGVIAAVSLIPGSASETITLTPAPASVQVGSARTFTATRSAPAGAGGVTYNVSSDNPAVATVPTPQALTEADSDLTFDATGVSVGTANITITNAADSSETDTVALTVTAVTTKRAKFLVHPDFASATGITIEVNEAPTGGALTGAKLGFATGIAAEATLESGQAVIKVNAADVGASALAAGTSVRAIFKGLAASGSALGSGAEAGSVVVATGTIIEE